MRTILYIIQKEFLQIFRNRSMLPIIFVVPLVQLLILVNAATYEMKHIRVAVVDLDLSGTSRRLVSKFQGSPFYRVQSAGFSYDQARDGMQRGENDMILHIPAGFEKSLVKDGSARVQFVVNAINGQSAGLINAYSTRILLDYNRQLVMENPAEAAAAGIRNIQTEYSFWYNPKLNYKTYMVPGILVLLVTIIGLLLSGMNIVREKEIGTIEQINVTPIVKIQFIAGKLIPFWIIGLFELAFGLTVGKLLFDIPMEGNLWLIFLSASVYLLVILSFGLLVSTVTYTQQQAMLVSFFFMVVFILMSGLFTSIESMPAWAQHLDRLNPLMYFIRIMRMVLLKGSGFADISPHFRALVIYAVASLGLAIARYRKVS
ncbi:MAG TPA: ABC transporter permease [Bacteroidales bacterium]|nr:ABC transporter permease [Bacteroidales bacterium]